MHDICICHVSGLQIRLCTGKLFFLFLSQNICCGYSKESSQLEGSFEHPKHMFKFMGKEINVILGASTSSSGPMMFKSKFHKNINFNGKFHV